MKLYKHILFKRYFEFNWVNGNRYFWYDEKISEETEHDFVKVIKD